MPKPLIQAIIICDNIYKDQATGKTVLAGTFSNITAPTFPAKHGSVGVYVALTDVSISGKIQIIFNQEDGNFKFPFPEVVIQNPKDRNDVVEVNFNIAGLPLPQSGNFEFQVLWDNQPIGSKRIKVHQARHPPGMTGPFGNPPASLPPPTVP